MNGLPLDSEYEKKEMMKDGQGHMDKNKFFEPTDHHVGNHSS